MLFAPMETLLWIALYQPVAQCPHLPLALVLRLFANLIFATIVILFMFKLWLEAILLLHALDVKVNVEHYLLPQLVLIVRMELLEDLLEIVYQHLMDVGGNTDNVPVILILAPAQTLLPLRLVLMAMSLTALDVPHANADQHLTAQLQVHPIVI